MNYFKKGKLFLLLGILLMTLVELQAQPTGYPTGDPDATPVQEVPIDGGLSLLLGAGIAYGAKRAYKNRKKSIDGELKNYSQNRA